VSDKSNEALMQDWFTDNHETFEQTFKTMTELYAEEFGVCATCEQQPWFSFSLDTLHNAGRNAQ
jgi:hypothetical protein